MINFTPSQWAGFAGDGAEAALRLGKNIMKSPPKAIGIGLFGLDLAVTAGTSNRGELGTNMAGSIGGNSLAIAGTVAGSAVAGPLGGLVGGAIGDYVGRTGAGAAVKAGLSMAKNSRAHLGGNYVDTTAAYTMRQRAAQELGGSLLNARRYLGAEGVMQH